MKDINTQNYSDDELKLRLEGLTDEQKDKLLKILQQDKKERKQKKEEEKRKPNPELIGNTEAILKDLKENHIKIQENVEMMGYKGKKIHIKLPAVGKFKGFKFDCFISYECIAKMDFEREYEEYSYSMSDVSKLLHAMNEYMTELKGKHDKKINYEERMKEWEYKFDLKNGVHDSNAGDCLKAITGLYSYYWLSDKYISKTRPRVVLNCDLCYCYFEYFVLNYYSAHLFLKLKK